MVKNLLATVEDTRDTGPIPGSGRSGEGNGNPIRYFVPEETHGQRSLWATVHRVAKSQTRLKRLGSTVIKTVWHWHKNQKYRSMENDWKINPCTYDQFIYDKGGQKIQ